MFYANYVMLFSALYSATTDLGLPCCFIVLAGFLQNTIMTFVICDLSEVYCGSSVT